MNHETALQGIHSPIQSMAERLWALGRSRRIVLGLPAFLPALAAVAASGALC